MARKKNLLVFIKRGTKLTENMHLHPVGACCLWIIWSSSFIFCSQMPDDWIDPLDPITYDPVKTQKDFEKYQKARSQEVGVVDRDDRQELFRADATDDQLVTCQKECTCDREKDEINKLQMVIKNQPACEMEYFKQHVTMLVSKLLRARLDTSSDISHFQIDVSVSNGDLKVLDDFAKGSAHVAVAHAMLNRMVQYVKQVDVREESRIDWSWWISCVSWVVITTVLILHAVRLQWQSAVPWTRLLGSIFIITFLISILWNWFHLYQKAAAKKIAKLQQIPDCKTEEMSIFSYITSVFSVKDSCVEYYQNLYVETWTEVPITMAVAVTFTKFLLEPLEHIGDAVSKMILASVRELPIQLQPLSLGLIIIAFLLVLIMAFNYNIRLFHFFRLEPSQPALQGFSERQLVRELMNGVRQDLVPLINDAVAQNLQPLISQLPSIQTVEAIHNRPMPKARSSDVIDESLCRSGVLGMTQPEGQSAQHMDLARQTFNEDSHHNVAAAAATSSTIGFDHLVRDVSTMSVPSQSEVEDVGSQEGQRSSLRPTETKDDSDLEIIEEEPENVQS